MLWPCGDIGCYPPCKRRFRQMERIRPQTEWQLAKGGSSCVAALSPALSNSTFDFVYANSRLARGCDLVLCRNYFDTARLNLSALLTNYNLHVSPKPRQTVHHLRFADSAKMPTQHIRQLRLREPQDLR